MRAMARLLMLHTGGTLGMQPRQPDRALALRDISPAVVAQVPELADIAEVETEALFNVDSTDMNPDHWLAIARRIGERVEEFDGVVISHGTDAMVYTACALSFLLRNLPVPVVLTGSQRPLVDPRSDGRANLVGACDVATRGINEVGIYFNGLLHRGNRAKKSSSFDYNAYSSPNFPPLAQMGATFHPAAVTVPLEGDGKFRVEGAFDDGVVSLNLIPKRAAPVLERLSGSGLRGVLIESYGVGNIPTRENIVADAIAKLTSEGMVVVIASQCMHGEVDLSRYPGGRLAAEAGAVGTGDMTVEAATVKLMYLLGTLKDPQKVREAMGHSLAGELTVHQD